MKYTKEELGKELKLELKKGYDIVRIANWAYDIYTYNPVTVSQEIDEILQFIFMMEAGPEFVLSEKDLKLLSEFLISEERDPVKKIYEMKFIRKIIGYIVEQIMASLKHLEDLLTSPKCCKFFEIGQKRS